MRQAPARRIFISYRREDTAPYAGRLYDRLAEHFGEAQVFMDVDSIEPGADFTEAIRNAVGSCDVLLALIGNEWLTVVDRRGQPRINDLTDYVHIEIETALQRNIRVIPILIEGAEMPSQDEFPSGLQALVRRQALGISHKQFRTDSVNLIQALERPWETGTRPRSLDEHPASKPELAPRWKLLGIEKEKFLRRLRISRDENHLIEYIIKAPRATVFADQILKVDGEIVDRLDHSSDWKEYWTFVVVDGGEEISAKLIAKGGGVSFSWRVTQCRLEIGDQILYSEG